ncbi:MAG: EamA/RhaT family transporter, partial [Rhodospirillaceae bacterium]|nr:EamA/RhaT family transporter [Rhodospirillaceae bacterium]
MAVMPFDFSRLPFAAIIGWIVFAELPDIWVWVGGAIIFGASLYIAHREMVASKEEAA